MFRDNEDRPFLNKEQDMDEPAVLYHRRKTNKILPPLLTFLITSLFWLLVMLWVRPDSPPQSPPTHDEHEQHSHKPLASEGAEHVHHDNMHNSNKDMHNGVHVHPPEPTYAPRHNITTNARLIDCGNTPQEAMEKKCTYDILLNAWVPEPCFEQDWIDEYSEDMSWGAYTDETMSVRLTVEEMGMQEHYYTSKRDHVNHCAMIWKKQFWVLFEEKRAIDTIMASPGHTDHCAQYLVDAWEVEPEATTKVQVGFAKCWIRD